MRYRARGRKSTGHEFAEFAPAVFILMVCIALPMLDLLYLGIAYASGWYLNHLEVREAACAPPGRVSDALARARIAWEGSTLAKFTKGREVSATPNPKDVNPSDNFSPDTIQITTQVQVQPFLQIPFMGGVPGIGSPITYQYTSERTQEERGIN